MSKFSEIINSNKPVLIDFYAEWCGPCQTMKPVLNELKTKIANTATIIKIDIDKNQQLAENLKIKGVPTFMIFKNGETLWRQSGLLSSSELEKVLKQYS